MVYWEVFRMLYKPYKITKTHIELMLDFNDEKNFDILVSMLKVFNLQTAQLVCSCAYDDKRIALSVVDGVVKVDIIKNRPFVYAVVKRNLKVFINSDFTLKELLQISNNHDVMLTIMPTDTDNSKTNIIINDNGHDYILFDKNEFDVQEIREKFKQIIR